MYDSIVIGAGPAGLQAALTLGRMHRRTLVLDSAQYRNGPVSHMHNVLGDDGTPPADHRARAHAQLTAYPDVVFRAVIAESVTGSADDFTVALDDGRLEHARRIILATGVVDELPAVPGLEELWGRRAFACPFCDGHEFHGAEIGIIGDGARAEHLMALLDPVVDGITVFPVENVDSVRPGPGNSAIVTAGGTDTEFAGLFVAVGSVRQRADFATQLGLRMLPSGAIEIDDFGRTSMSGVFAAGDLAHRATMPGPMASVIQAAAAGQSAASFVVQELNA